jgi:regulatory protein
MKELTEAEILRKVADYCSVAERCVSEVEKKIKSAGLSDEACERIISRLKEEKFLDERRYAGFFVRDKYRFNKWGKVKINYELQKKGIPSNIREDALDENIDEDEYERIVFEALKNKLKSVKSKDSYDLRTKLFRFGTGRGFEARDISKALSKLLTNTDSDDDYEYME